MKVVIKVNGRFYKANKVQNEVVSLLLLDQHCPDVPAPRLIAWSDDGTTISAIRDGASVVIHNEFGGELSMPPNQDSHGWIMTTKLPGRVLQQTDLVNEPSNKYLASDLAGIVASWRTKIPGRGEFGNFALDNTRHDSPDDVCGMEIKIVSPILCETQTGPITFAHAYYDHMLADQLTKIETKEVFTLLRPRLLPNVVHFRHEILPRLFPSTDNFSSKATFTQQDLAPRNVLVIEESKGMRISGILDFEFAGMFPDAEEFVNCTARQAGDWPATFWQLFMEELKNRGVVIPHNKDNGNMFENIYKVARLTENIAPWWLEDGHVTGEQLEKELTETSTTVIALLEELISYVNRKM